ncbi:hypothetical protein MAL1_00084 [Bacteriophage DSS3_MAL1]|nr:hypothetical protein MAL1_00084 [Bacteriophage DSS3_MAL1]
MLALLLSSVSASAIIAAAPSEPPATEYTATPHTLPSAPYWRCRFWGGESGAYFSVAELEFREDIGGASVATGGTAISSGERSGFGDDLAFDGDGGTAWSQARPGIAWLGYHFASSVTIREVAITARTSWQVHTPTVIVVEASQDGTTWDYVTLITRTTSWGSGETATYQIGSGYFSTRNTRVGFNTNLDHDVMGQVFTASETFTITSVGTYINAGRKTQAAVVLVDPVTYEITEIISQTGEIANTTVPETTIQPARIEEGETFAILFWSSDSEVQKNVQVRYVNDDFYQGVASPVTNWIQLSKNVTVGATPDGTTDTNHTLIFFEGVFRNGEGSFPSGAFPIPDFVPIPAGWYSPASVTVDGSGVITTIPNLGWRGSAADATPTASKEVTITTAYNYWGAKPVFAIPDTSGGFAVGEAFEAHSFASIATYGEGDVPASTFGDYAAFVSGPSDGNTTEFELIGHSGNSYFFSGKVDTIMAGDRIFDDGTRPVVLPLYKTPIGGIEFSDGRLFGMLWVDNFTSSRNWHGTSGDVLVFPEELSETQLALLGEALESFYQPSPEVTPVSAATAVILGGGYGGSLSSHKANTYFIFGGGGAGTLGTHTHNVYAVIQE